MQNAQLTQSVQIEIKGNKYNAVFPNTGQYMDIRNRISILISDLNIRDVYDQYAALLAEMIATYNVLLPELKKDINVDSILKLSMMESKEILDTYTDVYKPFFDQWMAVITAPKTKPENAA
jgi:hypothetical protein